MTFRVVKGVTRVYTVGSYAADEETMVMVSTRYVAGGPIVLVCPGAATTAWGYSPEFSQRRWHVLRRLADAGCVVCVGTFSDPDDGGSSWGNEPGRTRMSQAITWLGQQYRADTSRVGIIGDSEGGVLALNFLWRNPDITRAVVTQLSPVNVDSLYQSNGIVQATIDIAFDTLGGWEANKATHDPWLNMDKVAPYSDRVRFYVSEDDVLVPLRDQQIYAEHTKVEVVPVGAIGHDFNKALVDPAEIAGFILARL